MRFLFALLIAVALLGAVAWTQRALTRQVRFDVTRDVDGHAPAAGAGAAHTYRVDVMPAFDAVRDPFAVSVDQEAETPRLVIRQAGAVLLQRTEDMARGETVSIDGLALAGKRVELFVEAVPSEDDARFPCALRLRVFRDDGALCDDVTLWSAGGGLPVSGTIVGNLEPDRAFLDRGLGGDVK
jgi:hypothetical protein